MTQLKEKRNLAAEIVESQIRDIASIAKTSRNIDNLRARFGKSEKGHDSTEILRKIREARIR